jgi:dolichol-phosphate mannosyltransferase
MRVSLVIPTYNEVDNIARVIRVLSEELKEFSHEIIVVDDNSPDNTAEVAQGLCHKFAVQVIKRIGIRGLSSAILEGFRNAQGDVVGVIDADFQHPPEIIPKLIAAVQDGADIAIASRYVPGGGTEGWSMPRRIISKGYCQGDCVKFPWIKLRREGRL